MTREPIEVTRQDRIYCLKVSSDYHSEVCEECKCYPNCDHMTQDDMTELTIEDLEALEQEPCEDEYIKVPKKALKYRTAGMVAYNTEWLKNHFDIERVAICGAQEPKTGHWITKIKSDLRGDMWPTNPKCSECGGEPYYSNTIYNYKYCPYCGAKMVEEQESEDKE